MRLLLPVVALALLAAAPATSTKSKGSKAPATAPAAAVVAWPTPTSFTTADGLRLSANWARPARAENAVVFVHGQEKTSAEWSALALKATQQGLMAVTMDLRGHGASTLGHPLGPEDYRAMTQDVRAAVAFARQGGAKRVAIVGGELGANLAIDVAAEDRAIASVVGFSMGTNIKGVVASDAAKRFEPRPVLLVASSSDAYSLKSAQILAPEGRANTRVEIVDADGRGASLLGRDPKLENAVFGFIQASWAARTDDAPKAELNVGASRAVGPVQTIDVKTTPSTVPPAAPTPAPAP